MQMCTFAPGRFWWYTGSQHFWHCSYAAESASLCISDGVTGELRISNHSQSLAGLYLCRANNAVGSEHCRIVLKANKCKDLNIMLTSTWHYKMSVQELGRPRFHSFKCSVFVDVPQPPYCSISTHWINIVSLFYPDNAGNDDRKIIGKKRPTNLVKGFGLVIINGLDYPTIEMSDYYLISNVIRLK